MKPGATVRQRVVALAQALGFSAILLAALALSHPVVMTSDSMAPGLGRGDLALTAIVPASRIAVGDVIVREVPGAARVTHRVVSVTTDQGTSVFTTKGDANTNADPTPLRVRGRVHKVVRVLPFLGWPFLLASHGSILSIAGLAAGIGLLLATRRRRAPSPLPSH